MSLVVSSLLISEQYHKINSAFGQITHFQEKKKYNKKAESSLKCSLRKWLPK